ncbi:ATP-binding cassette domain-containing protein, partial [Streptomyces achromogenes]|uniref:ABC transporter ATP-binding protein n=1 Tax=Streptomyces achromogenes TaxID=67255 RepID=UPI00340F7C9A
MTADLLTSQPTTGIAAATTDLTKVYGSGDTRVVALDRVSIAFREGEFTAIMGPSGCGKSTLMHCAAGLDSPTSGSVRVGTTELARLGDRELTQLRRDRIGFVFQAFNLLPTLTALENITLPMDIAGRRPDRAWLDRVVSMVGYGGAGADLDGRLSRHPRTVVLRPPPGARG